MASLYHCYSSKLRDILTASESAPNNYSLASYAPSLSQQNQNPSQATAGCDDISPYSGLPVSIKVSKTVTREDVFKAPVIKPTTESQFKQASFGHRETTGMGQPGPAMMKSAATATNGALKRRSFNDILEEVKHSKITLDDLPHPDVLFGKKKHARKRNRESTMDVYRKMVRQKLNKCENVNLNEVVSRRSDLRKLSSTLETPQSANKTLDEIYNQLYPSKLTEDTVAEYSDSLTSPDEQGHTPNRSIADLRASVSSRPNFSMALASASDAMPDFSHQLRQQNFATSTPLFGENLPSSTFSNPQYSQSPHNYLPESQYRMNEPNHQWQDCKEKMYSQKLNCDGKRDFFDLHKTRNVGRGENDYVGRDEENFNCFPIHANHDDDNGYFSKGGQHLFPTDHCNVSKSEPLLYYDGNLQADSDICAVDDEENQMYELDDRDDNFYDNSQDAVSKTPSDLHYICSPGGKTTNQAGQFIPTGTEQEFDSQYQMYTTQSETTIKKPKVNEYYDSSYEKNNGTLNNSITNKVNRYEKVHPKHFISGISGSTTCNNRTNYNHEENEPFGDYYNEDLSNDEHNIAVLDVTNTCSENDDSECNGAYPNADEVKNETNKQADVLNTGFLDESFNSHVGERFEGQAKTTAAETQKASYGLREASKCSNPVFKKPATCGAVYTSAFQYYKQLKAENCQGVGYYRKSETFAITTVKQTEMSVVSSDPQLICNESKDPVSVEEDKNKEDIADLWKNSCPPRWRKYLKRRKCLKNKFDSFESNLSPITETLTPQKVKHKGEFARSRDPFEE